MKTVIWTIIVVSLLVGATVWVWGLHGNPRIGIDDANIFFTYAENLAAGKGITYAQNGERVEGFTSMLWMLVCTGMFALGWNEWGVLACSVLLFVLTQFLFLAAIRRQKSPDEGRATRLWQAAYLVLILSAPAYIAWMTITLMDTCLWGLTIAAMTLLLVVPPKSRWSIVFAAMVFAAAPAVRPEALLVAPVYLVLLWMRCRTVGVEHPTGLCAGLALLLVAAAIGLTLFRMQYFGLPFPNTYYAKVSPSLLYNLREGKYYLYQFVISGPVVGILVLVVLIACAGWFGRFGDAMRHAGITTFALPTMSASIAVSLAAFMLLVVPVLTGGDHFGMFRFYQPAYPLLVLSFVLVIKAVVEDGNASWLRVLDGLWWKRNMLAGGAISLAAAYWLFAYASEFSWSSMRWGSPIGIEFRLVKGGAETGTCLNRLFADVSPRPSVGVMAAGSIARTYEGRLIDLFGLNNSYIAHFKGDRKGKKNHAAFEREAFYGVEPDILLAIPPKSSETNDPGIVCMKGLLDDPRFTGRWRYGTLSRSDGVKEKMNVFVRNDFLDRIGGGTHVEFRDTMVWSNHWVEVGDAGKMDDRP